MDDGVAYLRTPTAIRERCGAILERGLAGELSHFAIDLDKLPTVAERVASVTREAYPDLEIPYHSRWGHFRVGDLDLVDLLDQRLTQCSKEEKARCRFDLVTTSVLLDAGAGDDWQYRDPWKWQTLSRSEGLAVASFAMFLDGVFSSDRVDSLRADAWALRSMDTATLEKGFQVSEQNPLVGLDGRAELLRRDGAAVASAPEVFGEKNPRIGGLFDFIVSKAKDGEVQAADVLAAVLEGFSSIWPGRLEIDGENLGDVWKHPFAGGDGTDEGLVPFHKLSQWLAYSLIEPIESAGYRVVGADDLTALAEYRNGGLLVDLGLIAPKDPDALSKAHDPSSELVVEWRALTLALMDRVADAVRQVLGVDSNKLPLGKVLEGGTWRAGRAVAKELREGGGPPIRVESDGTVF